MPRHLQRELEALKKRILALGGVVEESVREAVVAVQERDPSLAEKIIAQDSAIDETEVEIEEECLKLLALHQPVAVDLRFIVAVLKINNDLERIGDLAVNIAERAVFLSRSGALPPFPFDFPAMADKAQQMLKNSLDALVNMDGALARKVCAADDVVDELNREMYRLIQDGIRQYPENVEDLIHLLSISRQLERIGDSATNIAEDVIYMVEGEIVRHWVKKRM